MTLVCLRSGDELSEFAVAATGNAGGDGLAPALGELGEAVQRSPGFDGVIDRDWVGNCGFPAVAVVGVSEVGVAAGGGEAVGLTYGDNAQPRED